MYYLAINGQKAGPFEASDVQQMLRQGAIGYDTLFWQDGMRDWEPINSQLYLFDTGNRQTPRTQSYHQPASTQNYYQPQLHQQPMPIYQQPVMIQPVIMHPPKTRVAFILLGLFLGGLGIHNFYAGYSSKGLTQLLLNLFLFWTIIVPIGIGIWVLIEVCTIDHDAYGNRMA